MPQHLTQNFLPETSKFAQMNLPTEELLSRFLVLSPDCLVGQTELKSSHSSQLPIDVSTPGPNTQNPTFLLDWLILNSFNVDVLKKKIFSNKLELFWTTSLYLYNVEWYSLRYIFVDFILKRDVLNLLKQEFILVKFRKCVKLWRN